MKDLILTILKIIAPFSVAFTVFAQGLKISPGQVMTYFNQRRWLMLRSILAVVVLVPLAALAIILLLKPSLGVGIGLAILVACPPAPMMFKTTPKLGEGSAVFMASLHLSLALLAFFTVPAVLDALSVPLSFHADVDLLKMAATLGRTILVPILLGLAVRFFFPAFADRFGPNLEKAGGIGVLVVVLFAAVAFVPWLLQMDLPSYLIMVVVCGVALAIGYFVGPSDPHERTSLSVECAVRHPALAITIAASNFTPQKALPVMVPCVLTFMIVAMIFLVWQKKRLTAGSAASYPAPRQDF
jgi:BASS family bile acid:Na+ symporter